MWKQHKILIISVIALVIVTIVIAIFGNKIFKKKSPSNTDETDYTTTGNSTTKEVETSIGTFQIPQLEIKAKKVGDNAYSNAKQQIARVEIVNGHYTSTGSMGNIDKNSLIGTVAKLTPHGYYIKAKPGLAASYYYAGSSQVK